MRSKHKKQVKLQNFKGKFENIRILEEENIYIYIH